MHRRPVIELLPEEARTTLRSTQILTTLAQLVSELVQNSLDAGAHQVDVGVDPEAWACWVRDDGCGIPREGLELLARGKEKGRYATSKTYGTSNIHVPTTFGFRGEALASAIDLAKVEISSTVAENRESWCIVVRGGHKLYSGPARKWRGERTGSLVNIRDAFYNLPVRRSSHPTVATTFQTIRREIEKLALMFPHVGFTVEKATGERGPEETKTRLLTIVKTPGLLPTFGQLFGRGLIQNVEIIKERHGNITIEGFLSREGSCAKTYQFLYINRHPVTSCELHHAVDVRFAATSFGSRAADESGDPISRAPSKRSPRKSERTPVYVLNIGVPSQTLDRTLEPTKTDVYIEDADTVVSFLGQTVESFLTRNGFPPRSIRKLRVAGSPATSPPPTKRSRDDRGHGAPITQGLAPRLGPEDAACHHGGVGVVRRSSAPDIIETHPVVYPDLNIALDDCWIPWRDPHTGELHMIDKRTGNTFRQRGDEVTEEREFQEETPRLASGGLVDRSWLRGTPKESKVAARTPWMASLLEMWPNPTFHAPSRAVPDEESPKKMKVQEDVCHMHDIRPPSMKMLSRIFDAEDTGSPLDAVSSRLSKANLAKATVLGQVDRKFIACRLPLLTGGQVQKDGMLVLVDQHAADERVRVERFLQDLCSRFLHHRDSFLVARRELDPPKVLLVTKQDCDFVRDNPEVTELFARWGFIISLPTQDPTTTTPEKAGNNEAYTIEVFSIPEAVAVKLLLGDELRETVKGFLAKLQEGGLAGVPVMDASLDFDPNGSDRPDLGWMKALRWCPEELIDLVNSRACRGAIMFNDSLTQRHCELLVQQLGETALPFQCAHGRPSMVPLAYLNAFSRRTKKTINWKGWQRGVQ